MKSLPVDAAGNLPNVDGNRQHSDVISQTHGYGSADITKQHDHTQNTAGSGKQVYAESDETNPLRSVLSELEESDDLIGSFI